MANGITAAQAIEAIREAHGFVTQAAKRLGCSRTHLYNIINDKPTVKEALVDAKEEMKDFAESKIYAKIRDGDTTMLIFYAKTQMKDRGYIERQELTGKDGSPLIVVNWDDNQNQD